MSPTDDAAEVTAAVTRANVWAKWIAIIGGALIALIGPAITAHQLAVSEARQAAAKVAATAVQENAKAKVEGQATKNEAEAGYQVLLKEVEVLRAEKVARERAQPHRRRIKAPKALPTDLKQAEKVVFANAPVPAAPAVPPVVAPVIVPYRDASP
jgi:hypothetical protein